MPFRLERSWFNDSARTLAYASAVLLLSHSAFATLTITPVNLGGADGLGNIYYAGNGWPSNPAAVAVTAFLDPAITANPFVDYTASSPFAAGTADPTQSNLLIFSIVSTVAITVPANWLALGFRLPLPLVRLHPVLAREITTTELAVSPQAAATSGWGCFRVSPPIFLFSSPFTSSMAVRPTETRDNRTQVRARCPELTSPAQAPLPHFVVLRRVLHPPPRIRSGTPRSLPAPACRRR